MEHDNEMLSKIKEMKVLMDEVLTMMGEDMSDDKTDELKDKISKRKYA
jgi:hypothetical protein